MKTIGVIGLGNMGRGMALSLQRGGFTVLGSDAAAETRQALAAEGVETTASANDLCARCDAIVLSLPNAAIIETVVLGTGGLREHAKPGLLVIDTSTSHPDTTRKLDAILSAIGVDLIDAPVSGGPKGAISATMTMVIGGTDAAVARAEPILAAMSAKRVHVGGVGAGHTTKIVNNLLCAAHLLTAAEAVRLAQAAGLAPERLLEGINAGSGRSAITQVNFPTWILNGAFDSGFTMKLMRKDVGLAEDLIGTLDLDLPIAAAVAQLWRTSAQTLADGEDFNRIVDLQGPLITEFNP
jgi:3-hydroxyisobutyrate dehydrogenase